MSQPPKNINFERCEDEPIHIPESIQSYGFLIAFNYKDLKISIVSDNCESVFTEPLIGKHFLEILSSDTNERAFLEETFDFALVNVPGPVLIKAPEHVLNLFKVVHGGCPLERWRVQPL